MEKFKDCIAIVTGLIYLGLLAYTIYIRIANDIGPVTMITDHWHIGLFMVCDFFVMMWACDWHISKRD